MRPVFVILGVLIFLALSIYFYETNQKGMGYLTGKVDIGPLCPVEKPSDDTCKPSPEMYRQWPIGVYRVDKGTKVADIVPDVNGTYWIELPPGKYVVDLEIEHRSGKNLPAVVTIRENETTVFDIHIDTGIR